MYAGRAMERAAENAVLGAEFLDLTRRLGDEDHLAASLLASEASARLGNLTAWNDLLSRLQEPRAITRQPMYEHALLVRHHIDALLAGDLTRAQDLLRQAEELGQRLGWGLDGVYALSGILLRREQGRLANLAPALRAFARMRPEGALWAPGLASLYAELGMTSEAREQFERLAAGEFATVPRDDTRALCLGLLAEVCATLGDRPRAAWLHRQLRGCEGMLLLFPGMGVCIGPADRLLAKLDAVLGDDASAERRHGAALELSRALPSPLWTAHCLHDLGGQLRTTRPEEAATMLFEAAELCERHGLAGLAPRVATALRGT